MERVGRLWPIALVGIPLLAGCPGQASTAKESMVNDGPQQATVTIYRAGDQRLAMVEETIYRPDGNNRTLSAVNFPQPVALVVETARLPLESGRQTISLPRVPAQAAPSSLWLQSLTSTGAVRLDSVEPRQSGTDGLLGRRVRVEIDGERVVGTAVEVTGNSISVRTDDGKLWLVSTDSTTVALESDGQERPLVTLEVDRAGEHLIEVGYTTEAIDWTVDWTVNWTGGGDSTGDSNFENNFENKDANKASEPADAIEISMTGLLSIINGTDTDFGSAAITVFSGTLSSPENHPIALWRGNTSFAARASIAVPIEPPPVSAAIGYEYRPSLRIESGERSDPLWGQSASTEVSRVLWLTPEDGGTLVAGKIAIRAGDRLYESLLRERVTAPSTASVRLEEARKIRGRRTQQATRRSRDGESFTESIMIEIENRSSVARTVKIFEELARSPRFELVKSSPSATLAGSKLRFELEIEPGATKKARYTVRYTM